MADEVERRLQRLEAAVDNGKFIRKETYEANQRAQERTDIAQEQRFSDLRDEIQSLKEDSQWLRRSLIGLLFTIIAAATIAALAVGAAA